MGRIKKLRALTWDQWRYLLWASLLLPGTAIMLRLIGYQRTLALCARSDAFDDSHTISDQDVDIARRVAQMIDLAAIHGLYRARCLQKSLVLVNFLSIKSIPCRLILGANLAGEKFGAHAWVECAGEVINDKADVGQRFVPFDSPPEKRF